MKVKVGIYLLLLDFFTNGDFVVKSNNSMK